MEQPYVRCHESVTVAILARFLRKRILSVAPGDLTVGHLNHMQQQPSQWMCLHVLQPPIVSGITQDFGKCCAGAPGAIAVSGGAAAERRDTGRGRAAALAAPCRQQPASADCSGLGRGSGATWLNVAQESQATNAILLGCCYQSDGLEINVQPQTRETMTEAQNPIRLPTGTLHDTSSGGWMSLQNSLELWPGSTSSARQLGMSPALACAGPASCTALQQTLGSRWHSIRTLASCCGRRADTQCVMPSQAPRNCAPGTSRATTG